MTVKDPASMYMPLSTKYPAGTWASSLVFTISNTSSVVEYDLMSTPSNMAMNSMVYVPSIISLPSHSIFRTLSSSRVYVPKSLTDFFSDAVPGPMLLWTITWTSVHSCRLKSGTITPSAYIAVILKSVVKSLPLTILNSLIPFIFIKLILLL